MNWYQTSSGLSGPYIQMSVTGAWETGSTAAQPFDAILRGLDGSQTQTYTQLSLKLLDVDGNGTVDALTDGLILLRYLFGLRGPSLTAGAIGVGATRDEAQIEAYIQTIMY